MFVFHHATVERRDNATRVHTVGDGLRCQAVCKVLGVGDNAALAGGIGGKLRSRMSARRPHIDHGFDSRRRLGGKPLPHKGVALGHVDGSTQVGGDVVGRILRTGNVHDYLRLKVAWKRVRFADINDQMAVTLVFDRRRQKIKAHDLVALVQKALHARGSDTARSARDQNPHTCSLGGCVALEVLGAHILALPAAHDLVAHGAQEDLAQ